MRKDKVSKIKNLIQEIEHMKKNQRTSPCLLTLKEFADKYFICKDIVMGPCRLAWMILKYPGLFHGSFIRRNSKASRGSPYYVDPDIFYKKILNYPFRFNTEKRIINEWKNLNKKKIL